MSSSGQRVTQLWRVRKCKSIRGSKSRAQMFWVRQLSFWLIPFFFSVVVLPDWEGPVA